METVLSEKISGQTMVCPVCRGKGTSFLREAFDDRYGQPELFSLVVCDHCGHVMTAPRLEESDLGLLYGTYYPRKHVDVEDLRREAGRTVTRFAALRRWWMGTDNQGQYSARPGESVLDVGCGSGLSLMEAQALGAQVRGVEADPNVSRLAGELNLPIHIGSLFDEPFPGELFDLVTLNQVIEHIPEPDRVLERLRSRLRPGGRLVLVFPNVRSFWCRIFGVRWINWHVPYHLHHFSREGFAQLAGRCGYRITTVRTITPNLWTALQLRTLRFTVSRGVPSPMWGVAPTAGEGGQSKPALRRRVLRTMRRAVFAMGILPLALINRSIDALGWGDSLMVELVPMERA